jgi:ABC-type phosphate/phosphonate transport system permease subunit
VFNGKTSHLYSPTATSARTLTAILKEMDNIDINNYFSDILKFLRNEDDNVISFKKVVIYILFVLVIISIGQISVTNSYETPNLENQKFIKDEIKRQIIIDTNSIQSSYCKGTFLEVKLENNSIYPINLKDYKNVDRITINSSIEKKTNDKKFQIISNNIIYKFEISEISDQMVPTRVFVFFGTLMFGLIAIPLWLNENERQKQKEKNSR